MRKAINHKKNLWSDKAIWRCDITDPRFPFAKMTNDMREKGRWES